MAEVTLVIGSDAHTTDGASGEVRSAVVDPGAQTVSHLVVEPKGRRGLARLVPLDHVDAGGGAIILRYTEAEFMDLRPAEETLAEFIRGYESPVQLLTPGWQGTDDLTADGASIPVAREMEDRDLVPDLLPGEDEEHAGDRVLATDGEVGRLRALRVDPETGQVTGLLLREGHFWGRKEVAIPAGVVSFQEDGIRLSVTKEQAGNL